VTGGAAAARPRSHAGAPTWAVVTGATSGIGLEFAVQLAARGFALVIGGRRGEILERSAAAIAETHGVAVEVIVGDLGDRAVQDRFVDAIATKRVELLVNNAGAGFGGALHDVPSDGVSAAFELLVMVPARLAAAALAGMYHRGSGTVINVGSLAGRLPVPRSSLYVSAKAALERLTESLALEAAHYGVVAQALLPGFVETDFHRDDPDMRARYRGRGIVRWSTARSVVDLSLGRAEHARARLARGTRSGRATRRRIVPRVRDTIVVPGWSNRLLFRVSRAVPRAVLYRIASNQPS